MDIAEVLEQAAVQKKDDLEEVRKKLKAATSASTSNNREVGQLAQEVEQVRAVLRSREELQEGLERELGREQATVHQLRLQSNSCTASIRILEQENAVLETRLLTRGEEVAATRRALHDCQRLLHSSEEDVDATIASKENLLKTFQALQSKHQVSRRSRR